MPSDDLLLRQVAVFASGVIYWGGVLIQARRIRRKIGHPPNLRPRTRREKLLWTGWAIVIAVWLVQPFLIRLDGFPVSLKPLTALVNPPTLASGLALIIGGYAGTLWTYAMMGSAWRIGINPGEKSTLVTSGPFRLVRHPIYLFQILMLIGVLFLLPTFLSLSILIVHFVCVLVKSSDEEAHLLAAFGDDYHAYRSHTGKLFPKLSR